jgi:hypothetical protein
MSCPGLPQQPIVGPVDMRDFHERDGCRQEVARGQLLEKAVNDCWVCVLFRLKTMLHRAYLPQQCARLNVPVLGRKLQREGGLGRKRRPGPAPAWVCTLGTAAYTRDHYSQQSRLSHGLRVRVARRVWTRDIARQAARALNVTNPSGYRLGIRADGPADHCGRLTVC